MELSPEERKRIYEEEKARIAEEEKLKGEKKEDEGVSSTNLEPNLVGFLCYLGFWITGIIFLILEQKSRFVRFHAMQSIITFVILMVANIILSRVPEIGWFFNVVFGLLTFVLWIVLMVKAYQGEIFKIPLAGDIAEKTSGVSYREGREAVKETVEVGGVVPLVPPAQPLPQAEVGLGKRVRGRAEDSARTGRAGRIASSSIAIAWSLVFIVFFNFFSKYIAYYNYESPRWVRYQVLITEDFDAWLPIVTTILVLSIVGHIVLIIYDRYFFRETTLLILNLFGVAAVVSLISIFPFDFSVIPDNTISEIIPIITTIILIGIAVGLGIATLVGFIKLLVNAARGTAGY